MPRIEFIHDQITKWYETEANGNGTSTFDLCKHCFKQGMSADDLNLTNKGYNGDPIPANAKAFDNWGIGIDLQSHPYHCTKCNTKLTNSNY